MHIAYIWRWAFDERKSGVYLHLYLYFSLMEVCIWWKEKWCWFRLPVSLQFSTLAAVPPPPPSCNFVYHVFVYFLFVFFIIQDSHFLRYPGILSALTLFFIHQHDSLREGLPYPPLPPTIMNLFLNFFVFAVLSHICAEKCSLWRSRWCGFRLPLSAPLVHSSIPAQRNAAFLRSISSERYLPPCSPSQLHVNVNICNHMQL